MKKQLLVGLILVVLIIVAVAAYFIVVQIQTKKSEEEAAEAQKLQMTSFSSSDVTKLVIHTPDFDYTIETDDDGIWDVASGDAIRVNTNYISMLCSYGSDLYASEDLGEVDKDTLEKYGLDDPISITYYTDTGSETLYVGNMTSTGEYFYMQYKGSDEVFLVSANTAGYLYVTKTQMRYRYVIADSSLDYTGLRITKDGDTIIDFTRADASDTWVLNEPENVPIAIDYSKITTLTYSIDEMEIDDFGDEGIFTDAQYKEYGYDDPAYTLTITQEGDVTTTLLFLDYDPDSSYYAYALCVETGEVYEFLPDYISFLQNDTSNYLVSTLWTPTLTDLDSMDVFYDGTYNDIDEYDIDRTFEMTGDGYYCDGIKFSDDSDAEDAFELFYKKLSNLAYDTFDTSYDTPDIEGVEPTLSVTYHYSDGEEHSLELYKNTSNTYWAYVDGTFSYATVRQKQLSTRGTVLPAYASFVECLDALE